MDQVRLDEEFHLQRYLLRRRIGRDRRLRVGERPVEGRVALVDGHVEEVVVRRLEGDDDEVVLEGRAVPPVVA